MSKKLLRKLLQNCSKILDAKKLLRKLLQICCQILGVFWTTQKLLRVSWWCQKLLNVCSQTTPCISNYSKTTPKLLHRQMSWTWSAWPGVMANITSNYAMLLPEDRLLDPMSPWLGGWICAIRWYTGPLKGRVYNGAHMAPLRLFSCLLHKETKLRVNTFYGHALHSFGEWTVNCHALQKNKEPTYVSSWLRTWAPPTSGNAPSSTNQPPI